MFFVAVLLGYGGIEWPASTPRRCATQRETIRERSLTPGMLLVGVAVLATLAIAIAVPHSKLNLVAGLMQAFAAYFHALGLGGWITRAMAIRVAIGTLTLISTWLLGPAKGLYASETTGDLPPAPDYVNKRHVLVAILLLVGSLFILMFLLNPSINTSYWMLTALTTQIVVRMYILVFAAAIRLRYTKPDTLRSFKVPGGKAGIWLVGGMGLAGCTFGLLSGCITPTGVQHWATPVYTAAMAAGILICSLHVHHRKGQAAELAHSPSRRVLVDVDPGKPAVVTR